MGHSVAADGSGIEGGGDLSLVPPTETNCTVYYDQAHYGPMSGGETEAAVKGGQAMVGAGRTGFGEDTYGGSGGVTDRRVGGDRRDRGKDVY